MFKKINAALKYGGQFVFTDLTEHIVQEHEGNLAFPVEASYYSKNLNKLGFTNVEFYWEKSWKEFGRFLGKNYCLFKTSK